MSKSSSRQLSAIRYIKAVSVNDSLAPTGSYVYFVQDKEARWYCAFSADRCLTRYRVTAEQIQDPDFGIRVLYRSCRIPESCPWKLKEVAYV